MPSPMCKRCDAHNSVGAHGLCYLCWTTVYHPTPDWRRQEMWHLIRQKLLWSLAFGSWLFTIWVFAR